MLIDWFTVAAQIVNFLILVALLKHFLYGRVIRAMDERGKTINARLDDAALQKEAAARETEALREKQREVENAREAIMSQARGDAEAARQQLLQEAKQEADALRSKWQEAVRREKDAFVRGLKQHAGREVYAVARRALSDLADAAVEERVIERFIDRIREMNDDEKDQLARSVDEARNSAVVVSGFDIAPALRERISETLREQVGDGTTVTYESSPSLILGIELKTEGRKIAWSLEDYLRSLEESARKVLEEQ